MTSLIAARFQTARIEEVSTATSFATALARGGFDIVVTEYELPWADGATLLRTLGDSCPGVPVVIFTRVDDTELAVAAMREGAADYLVKSSRNYLLLTSAMLTAVLKRRPRAGPTGPVWAPREKPSPEAAGSPDEPGVVSARRAEPNRTRQIADLTRFADAAARVAPRVPTGPFPAPVAPASPAPPAPPGPGRLERVNQELCEVIAQAAHELDAPLRMIDQHARVLSQGVDQIGGGARRALDLTLSGVRRMQELLDDFDAYARVEASELVCQLCDCNALVDEVVSRLVGRLGDDRIDVRRGDLPTVLADPSQLRQVFENLFSNAAKFATETPARAHVSSWELRDEWIFSVRDEGIGIDPEQTDSVFKLFQRLRPEYPGTGVGLAICRRVVERHGGRIRVESESGEGATFLFSLPKDPPRDVTGR